MLIEGQAQSRHSGVYRVPGKQVRSGSDKEAGPGAEES